MFKTHFIKSITLLALTCIVLVSWQKLCYDEDQENQEIEFFLPFKVFFGENSFPIDELRSHSSIKIFSSNWQNFKSKPIKLIRRVGNEEIVIESIEIFAENEANFALFRFENLTQINWKNIASKMGLGSSLYLKVVDHTAKEYIIGFKNDKSESLHLSNLLESTFIKKNNIRLVCDFKVNELGGDSLDMATAGKTYTTSERILPQYITNESYFKCRGQNLIIEDLKKDKVEILIKSSNGSLRKLSYDYDEDIKYDDLLQDHIDETTIYFTIGTPTSNSHRSGMLVISDERNVLAIQPSVLFEVLGISYDNVKISALTYYAADMDFVWGDIKLTLTKNAEGKYFSKQRVSKSKWRHSHLKAPDIFLGKNLHLDSLSFNMSIASEHIDTMNKIMIENIKQEDFNHTLRLNLPDTMSTLGDSKYNSVIKLDGNQEADRATNFSIELQLFDDAPHRKEKKYQFHWGSIDTTLYAKKKKNIYSESIELSLREVKNLLLKEPVLTSSQAGVLGAFTYQLIQNRAGKELQNIKVESNIRDAKLFAKTVSRFMVADNVLFGDQISLCGFQGKDIGIKDKIIVNLMINQADEGAETASVEESNTFLDWGKHKLKVTQLGNNSRKKNIKDQVVERESILKGTEQKVLLNRLGKKLKIVAAEWVINDILFSSKDCDKAGWKSCFSEQISKSRSGDFVSLFMRTSDGSGLVCQFYLDRISSEEYLSFGNSQFDSLLFKYAVTTTSKISSPQYNYSFVWGSTQVPLELRGNPRIYGGTHTIKQSVLEELLNDKIHILSSDGEVISVQNAYLIIRRLQNDKPKKKWSTYDFDCAYLDCALNVIEAKKILTELQDAVYSIRVFVDQHNQTEEFVKVSFIDFIIENESNAWVPQYWISKPQDNEVFDFQFAYQEKEKTLVKLDKTNSKYQWIIEKYQNDPTVEVLDMPGFKTLQRAIYTKYDWGNNESIRTTEVLSKDYTNAYTLYEFYDVASTDVKLYWKGYEASYGPQTYCRDDFICADGTLDLKLGDQSVRIVRGDLVVLPESGPGYKFVFDDINTMEIVTALKNIPFHTNIFFEHLLIENDQGEKLRLPMKFAFHLE